MPIDDNDLRQTSTARAIDVGIITIIPKEVEAHFRVFGVDPKKPLNLIRPLDYWETVIPSQHNNRDLRVVVSFLSGPAGNTESGIATAYFLRDWHTRLMCLSGICAGLQGKVSIGDVVVPGKIHDVCIRVIHDGQQLPRDDVLHRDILIDRMLKLRPPSSESLTSELRRLFGDRLAQIESVARHKGLGSTDFASGFKFRDGSLVSGNNLLRDSGYLTDVSHNKDEKCQGGEMEAAGFVRACEMESVPWVIVRGVADFGDNRKDDSFQELAAYSAAEALRLLLSGSIDFDHFPTRILGPAHDELLGGNIAAELQQAYKNKHWEQVALIGSFLSRPLWLSGRYDLRKHLGSMIEDAAAKANMPRERARALIDDLGWTSFALHDEESAIKYITDGVALARRLRRHYLVAKGERHLASIGRRNGQYRKAMLHLKAARSASSRITNVASKQEMESALGVSEAKVLIAQGRFGSAFKMLVKGKREYEKNNDPGRAVKLYQLLGSVCEAQENVEDAVQYYTAGYDAAERLGRKDELLSNARSLGLLYARAGKKSSAADWLTKAIRHASALNLVEEIDSLRQASKRLDEEDRTAQHSQSS